MEKIRQCQPPPCFRFSFLPQRGLLFILLLVICVYSYSVAQDDSITQRKAQLQTLQQQLKDTQAKYKNIAGKEENLLQELELLEQVLHQKHQQLQLHQEQLAAYQEELKELERNLGQLEQEHRAEKAVLAKRLRAIYKMGDLGYLIPLFNMSSYAEFQQQITYLHVISEHDIELIQTAKKAIQTIQAQERKVQERRQNVLDAQEAITTQQKDIQAQQQEKTQLLRKIRQDKQQYAQAIDRLEASARRLDELLEAESSKPPPTPTPDLRDAPTVKNPSNSHDVVRHYDSKYFRSNKGDLLWPVEGKIMTPYGRIKRHGTTTFYKGVDIQAAKGTPFYSVFKGTVRYADWFEGRGNLIILDHGGNYHTIYAHADELNVKAGDVVKTRQMLGRVGDTDSIKGAHLYFEVRANGRPEDPQRWLAKLR